MTSLRTHYEPHLGRWIVDTWVVLLPAQMECARQHTLKTQRQRYANMPPGDKRDTVAQSIDALEAGRIVRRPIPKTLESEATVFASTPGASGTEFTGTLVGGGGGGVILRRR